MTLINRFRPGGGTDWPDGNSVVDALASLPAEPPLSEPPGEATFQRNLHLICQASGAAEPSRFGCCDQTEPCYDHRQDQDAADLLTKIHRALRAAADDDTAGKAVIAILRGAA